MMDFFSIPQEKPSSERLATLISEAEYEVEEGRKVLVKGETQAQKLTAVLDRWRETIANIWPIAKANPHDEQLRQAVAKALQKFRNARSRLDTLRDAKEGYAAVFGRLTEALEELQEEYARRKMN